MSRLKDDSTSLSSIVSDWGPWDDTYNFVNGNEPDYISANLFPEAYKNLGVDLVVITNRQGRSFMPAYTMIRMTQWLQFRMHSGRY